MENVGLMIAVAGIVWRKRVWPYVKRYGYGWRTRVVSLVASVETPLMEYNILAVSRVDKGASHRARTVRRGLRDQIGNVRVVKVVRGFGYAERMSWIARHSVEEIRSRMAGRAMMVCR